MLICHIRRMDREQREQIMEGDEDNHGLRTNLRNGVECAVLNIECVGDRSIPEHNYYNVVFADGKTCEALSGHHLEGIDDWK